MADSRLFPIHPCDREKLRAIPWSLVEPHERAAQINHDQTIQRLAERGGLSIVELYYVLRDERLRLPFVSQEHAWNYLKERLELIGFATDEGCAHGR